MQVLVLARTTKLLKLGHIALDSTNIAAGQREQAQDVVLGAMAIVARNSSCPIARKHCSYATFA